MSFLYKINSFKSKIICSPIVEAFRHFGSGFRSGIMIVKMHRRLNNKGYNQDEEDAIISRFFDIKNYQIGKEVRENRKDLYQKIAEVSSNTGIPQWELRERLKKDFGIDI